MRFAPVPLGAISEATWTAHGYAALHGRPASHEADRCDSVLVSLQFAAG